MKIPFETEHSNLLAGSLRSEQNKQGGLHLRWGFRSMSIIGALALLLLLVIALMLPEGDSLALKDRAIPLESSPAHEPIVSSGLIFPLAAVQSTVTTTTEVTTTNNATTVPFQPVIASQCTGCIEGHVIDLWHKPAGAGWPVTVTLLETGEYVVFTVNADGSFLIPDSKTPPGLCPGTYKLELGIPDGWQPVTSPAITVTLNGKETCCIKVRFKVELLPCLKVIKKDVYMGVGLPDWEFTLTDDSGTVKVAQTNGQGEAYFYDLQANVPYTVKETVKDGWLPVDPASGQRKAVLPPPTGTNCLSSAPWVFTNKEIHTANILCCKEDPAGKPLAGWTCTLTRDDGTWPSQSCVTSAQKNGCCLFKNLALGAWTVTETVKPLYRALGPVSQQVTLTKPGSQEERTFTNEALGCIDGYKINHLGAGLDNWTITAQNVATGELLTTTTSKDPMGYFKFVLPVGTWKVAEDVKPGWMPVTAEAFTVDVKLPAAKVPKDCVHVRFKNETDVACLDVFKGDWFVDDPSRPWLHFGIPDWEITVEPISGGSAVSQLTDGTGWAHFDNLAPGKYLVTEEAKAGWVHLTANTYAITLEASGICTPPEWKKLGPANKWAKCPVHLDPDYHAVDPKSQCVTFWNIQESVRELDDPPTQTATKQAVTKTTAKTTKSACIARYAVRAGNTLYSIARRYGTTVNRLVQANHLANANQIYVGQVLCIK